jgi:hypothetical protein
MTMSAFPRLPFLLFGLTQIWACQSGDGESAHSGATNWLRCSTDQDCAEYLGASCGDDGICLDAQGERIVVSQSPSGDDDDSTNDDASDDDGATDDDVLTDAALPDDAADDDASDDDGATDDTSDDAGSSAPMTPSSGTAMESSMPAPEPDPVFGDALDSGIPSSDVDASVAVPSLDASALDASTCDLDSCHPERCDEVGEPCCDPFPSDSVNYCNAGLVCDPAGCRAPPECGPTTCAASDRCCDSCTGSCVDALSGANCPEDNLSSDFVCPAEEQQFLCGETLCGAVTTEYCESFTAGPGITTYTCRTMPAACEGVPTCECVLAELGSTIPETECSVGALGELLVVPPPAP